MIKVWNLPGGVHPAENKTQSMQAPLGNISLPSEMVHPLGQHIGAPAAPAVAVGDKVLAGQLIATAKGFISANIHASTSGVVSAIEDRPIVHPSGMDAPCIIITPDGIDTSIAFERSENYLALEHDVLLEKIRSAGITGMGGAGFPSAVKLNPRDPISTLIINGTECEPYITADDMLMQTRADDVVKGIELLAHLLGNPERVVIGIEDNKPDAIKAMRDASKDSVVEVASFPTKYPSGGEKQLIYILTGQEVPSGQLPASIGIVLQNVGTTVAALEAVRDGKPLFERITTVVGDALGSQRNILVKLGTPIRHVLEQHAFNEREASRLIAGGPMMGFALESSDAPIVKSSNCILAPSKQELSDPPPAQACIRCGMCAEACPASLLPQQMYWYTQAEDYDKLDAHNVRDCIECGACSFVCPSNIPLVQYFRAGKGAMRQIAVEKEKSDRSRQRFEFRQERIAKAEAEKEAKRAARKLAAEAAKKKLAAAKEADAGADTETPTASADPVAAAIARAKAKVLSPEEQQAKLERALSSAVARVEKAKTSVASSEGEKQQRFEAQLKQAELKLQDAQQKLDELKAAPATESAPAAIDESDPVAAAIARAKAKMDMDPREKLESNIESLNKRLAKSEEKLAKAKSEDSDTADALQAGLDKLKDKIAKAKQELSELPEPVAKAPTAPAEQDAALPIEQDAAALAIERAKAKAAANASMSPEDKLKDQLTSMSGRIDKAQGKLEKAKSEGSDTADALQLGLDKMLAKRDKLRGELEALNPAALAELDAAATKASAPAEQETPAAVEKDAALPIEKDAATLAIEKAKAKAAAAASMSPEEKLRDQVSAMEKRLTKAQQRLEKAISEDDANVEAFRSAAEKLEGKLVSARSELEAMT